MPRCAGHPAPATGGRRRARRPISLVIGVVTRSGATETPGARPSVTAAAGSGIGSAGRRCGRGAGGRRARRGRKVARGEQLKVGQAAILVLVRVSERRIGTLDKFLLVDLSVAIGVVIFEPRRGKGSVVRRQNVKFVLVQESRARFVRLREQFRRRRAPLIAGHDAIMVPIVTADSAKETLVDGGNIRARGAGTACPQAGGGKA